MINPAAVVIMASYIPPASWLTVTRAPAASHAMNARMRPMMVPRNPSIGSIVMTEASPPSQRSSCLTCCCAACSRVRSTNETGSPHCSSPRCSTGATG